MKKHLLLLTLPILLGLVGCKEEEETLYPNPSATTQYAEADIIVLTQQQLAVLLGEDPAEYKPYGADGYTYVPFFFLYSTRGELNLSKKTYMWVESEDGKTIWADFPTKEGEYICFSNNFDRQVAIDKYTSAVGAMLFCVESEIPGTNHCCIKFYQPHNRTYYTTGRIILEFDEANGPALEEGGYTYYDTYVSARPSL